MLYTIRSPHWTLYTSCWCCSTIRSSHWTLYTSCWCCNTIRSSHWTLFTSYWCCSTMRSSHWTLYIICWCCSTIRLSHWTLCPSFWFSEQHFHITRKNLFLMISREGCCGNLQCSKLVFSFAMIPRKWHVSDWFRGELWFLPISEGTHHQMSHWLWRWDDWFLVIGQEGSYGYCLSMKGRYLLNREALEHWKGNMESS